MKAFTFTPKTSIAPMIGFPWQNIIYRVEAVNNVSQSEIHAVNVAASNQTATITGLTYGVTYNIQVAAYLYRTRWQSH